MNGICTSDRDGVLSNSQMMARNDKKLSSLHASFCLLSLSTSLCPISLLSLAVSVSSPSANQDADNSFNKDELKLAVAAFGFPRHTMVGQSVVIITLDFSTLFCTLIFPVFFLYLPLTLSVVFHLSFSSSQVDFSHSLFLLLVLLLSASLSAPPSFSPLLPRSHPAHSVQSIIVVC